MQEIIISLGNWNTSKWCGRRNVTVNQALKLYGIKLAKTSRHLHSLSFSSSEVWAPNVRSITGATMRIIEWTNIVTDSVWAWACNYSRTYTPIRCAPHHLHSVIISLESSWNMYPWKVTKWKRKRELIEIQIHKQNRQIKEVALFALSLSLSAFGIAMTWYYVL